MKHFRKILSLATLLVAFGAMAFGQVALTSTTLSSAVTGGQAGYSGVNGPVQTTVFLASTTGITGLAAVNNQPIGLLYVDQEAMPILTVNATTGAVTVQRGQSGTRAGAHASGAMVLAGLNSQFQAIDPPLNGACTAANTVATPWVNLLTSNQWLCSTVTGTWVAGFGNDVAPPVPTAAVASAAGQITPSGPLFHITGTAAITGFLVPIGFNKGSFCVIPDAIFTTTATNNIALASTAVVNRPLCWQLDPATAKLYPSY